MPSNILTLIQGRHHLRLSLKEQQLKILKKKEGGKKEEKKGRRRSPKCEEELIMHFLWQHKRMGLF